MGVGCWPEDSDRLVPAAAFHAEGGNGVRALTEYQARPIDFLVDVLGIPRHTLVWSLNDGYDVHVWDGTTDPLVALLDALVRWEDVGVESGTGTGKSYLLAGVVLWFLAAWDGARVFTFAPKEDQLRLYMWAEIGRLWPAFQRRFPAAALNDLAISVDGGDLWGAWGFPVGVRANEESATKAQGQHAPHMLLIYEETPGIPLPVLVAGENTCTAPHNLRLAVGNPDNQQDTLHLHCTSPGVTPIRISALDHPNVVAGVELIPGAVARKAVERRRAKYGEGHRLYLSRIRGISPTESETALIRSEWVKAAQGRYADLRYRDGPPAWGVDVANSEAGDLGAIARGVGACLLEVVARPCPDANVLGASVVTEVRATPGGSARRVGVDATGVGAGTINEAKRLGMLVQALHSGASATIATYDEDEDVQPGQKRTRNEERFFNLRAQMWWQMAQDLQHGRVALPVDPELLQDLITPEWTTKGGKILVEAKEAIRTRLGRSPNKGDACVYWNWVRDRTRPVTPEPEVNPFDPVALAQQSLAQKSVALRRAHQQRRPTDPDFGDF